ncbi:MAG TPA: hypothetical protein VFP97_15960 [Chitinophagaceae bacterium]|nr:hypothetical protein [Chitinophagaceae bacterium]
MKTYLVIPVIVVLCGCGMMRKMADSVYIHQRTPAKDDPEILDSLLIVGNGNSATQRIMEEVMPLFIERLKQRGITSTSVFISYSNQRINETEFDNQNYAHTLWIYEQDRSLQKLADHNYLVPLAMKLTDNRTSDNVWIATSIFNDLVRKKFYRDRYAGTLVLLFRASGFVK